MLALNKANETGGGDGGGCVVVDERPQPRTEQQVVLLPELAGWTHRDPEQNKVGESNTNN